MEGPLVSVIIPVFNTASFLPECLDSIINQTYQNLEIICVDDGSTDNSINIINKYLSLDSRLILIQQKNSGQAAARNRALNIAKGKYISFVDSDDILDVNTFKSVLKIFNKEKAEIDAVIYNMEMFLPSGESFPCFTGPLYPSKSGLIKSYENDCCINITNAAPCIFKRSSINFLFKEGMIYEDWVFMVEFFSHKPIIYWLNIPFYKYRRDFKKSTTSNISKRCLDMFKAYELSCKILDNSNLKKPFSYINDFKILNEGIGFLEARLLECQYNSVLEEFIKRLNAISNSFPDAYYYSLTTFMNNMRKTYLDILRKQSDSNMNGDDNIRQIYNHLKLLQIKNIYKARVEKVVKFPYRILRSYAKKSVYMISPAYRMATYNNYLLNSIISSNNSKMHELQVSILDLQKCKDYLDNTHEI
ncbi:glycosyltransferase family 2 protein [Enterocloster lavalensis]|uniref:Glycosyl transferase family 2 n=1 Tax=Enterocloster lavalensis TaxID=460384 RepID=A0A1I0K9I6_9FIRM|nr:glycosyltransferase family 2 protein [Enterocloster lavalensis]SEU19684.1 Glycosyl transferase family 2 [Enterocloster lavalensis]